MMTQASTHKTTNPFRAQDNFGQQAVARILFEDPVLAFGGELLTCVLVIFETVAATASGIWYSNMLGDTTEEDKE